MLDRLSEIDALHDRAVDAEIEAGNLRAALTELYPSVENLRGYRVQGQESFLAHVDFILRKIATALND